MYIPKHWLLTLTLGFLLALAVVWLVGQNKALEARVDALESHDDDIAEIQTELATPATHTVVAVPAAVRTDGLDVAQLQELCAPSGRGTAQQTGAGGGGEFQADIETTKEVADV